MTDEQGHLGSNSAITTTTQAMYERHQQYQVLREIDEMLCEIVSGNQGSFSPHHGTVSMGNAALDILRRAYPDLWDGPLS